LKDRKKERLAKQKEFKKSHPEATEKEIKQVVVEDYDVVYHIYFSGHGTASCEGISRKTM